MKVGIIRYPGSNCDYDTLNFFEDSFFIWHKETECPNMDLLVIPGGFAFGDRVYSRATGNYTILPGEQAIQSPVTKVILEAYKKQIPIIGICNGFQILIKLKLLPGMLLKNAIDKFDSHTVKCVIQNKHLNIEEKELDIPTANQFGRYYASDETLINMESNNQIFLKYKTYNNGSSRSIAGICNKEHTVFGMMPHPERSSNKQYFTWFFNKLTQKKDIKYHINNIMASEHVSYKSTAKYLSKLYTTGDNVIQGPGENAGIVDIGGGYAIAIRIESHNHPIFIDPYNGAATGVGGILRDIFTMGARPIALLDFLRFGNDDYNAQLIPEVINGISDYGNCIGVPNIGGDFYKDDTYNYNPLLNVACIGLVKRENIVYGNALNEGSLLIYVGSKTGNEGVGGADMASQSFVGGDTAKLKDNIQTGDPFLEKLLLEACQEITDRKLAEGMQDMGAGGILCSTVEVISRGRKKTHKNLGCNIYLDKIPTKGELKHSSKLISESQERMLIIAKESNKAEIFEVFKKWDLEYDIIGISDDTGNYSVYNGKNLLFEQSFDAFDYPKENWEEVEFPPQISELKKIKDTDLWKEYDSTIGCRTIKGPLKPGSYSILDIPEVNKHLVVTWGKDFDECYSEMENQAAKPLGIINCLNFGHPKDSMGEFARLVDEFNQKCLNHKIPVLGGNVSLYNATNDVSIKPTIVLVMIGLKDKVV